ncbi:hypothetical protein VNO78_20222 [Psophocarpus tetragonolobus]|uniref:Uncharacterized protein n=1 Tax=Psophocarpus tetragonolobus TaxID=3891 RepID=A0AAN9S9X7_PSOTE
MCVILQGSSRLNSNAKGFTTAIPSERVLKILRYRCRDYAGNEGNGRVAFALIPALVPIGFVFVLWDGLWVYALLDFTVMMM